MAVGIPVSKLWHSALPVAIWFCLAHYVTALVFAKEHPSEALQKFVEKKLAKNYMNHWKPKKWQSAGNCNIKNLPAATLEVVNKTCGERLESGDRCPCIVAKAHSCHVGCGLEKKAKKELCPAECSARTCKSGEYSEGHGGLALHGGHVDGKCFNYCSKEFTHAGGVKARYCGSGYWYETGDFIDCTGCNPKRPLKKPKKETKKEAWTKCMVSCFPNPTCHGMCSFASADCYPACVKTYTSAVEPFWDLFKHSDKDVSDYVPK